MVRGSARWSSIANAITTAVSTPRRVFTVLAGNSLFFRVVPESLLPALGRAADTVADLAVIPLAVTAIAARGDELQVIGVGFEWLLLGYIVYRFFPRLFPGDGPVNTELERRRFRVLVTALALLWAVPLADLMPSLFGQSVLPPVVERFVFGGELFAPAFVGWIVGSALLLGGYLYTRWWHDATIDDRMAFMTRIRPGKPSANERDKIRERLGRDDWVGSVTDGLGLLSAVFVLVLVCLFFSLSIGIAGTLFPLPQVVVLVGVTGSLVGERFPERTRLGRFGGAVGDRSVDIEARLYTLLRYVSTSRKGMIVAPFYFLGTLTSILLTLVSFVAFAILVVIVVFRPEVFLSSTVPLLTRWNVAGYLICGTVPGLYSLWFWIRETGRIPHYLRDWERRHSGTAAVAEETLPDPVTRPPGVLLVPTALVVLFAAFVRIASDGPVLTVPNAAFALGWPLALAATVWSIRWTFRSEPQPLWTESYALPAAFAFQALWLWLLLGTGLLDQRLFSGTEIVTVVGFGITMFYVPDGWVRLRSAVARDWLQILIGGVASGTLLVGYGFVWVFAGLSEASMLFGAGAFLIAFSALGAFLVRLAGREEAA